MNVLAQETNHRGMRLLAAHLESLDPPRESMTDQNDAPRRSRFRQQRRPTCLFSSCELPQTISRCCLVLLLRRALSKKECMASPDTSQRCQGTKNPQFAIVE